MESTLSKLELILSQESNKLRQFFNDHRSFDAASGYIRGLLSKVDRKNGWQIAESIGEVTPYRFQHMLNRGSLDANLIRDYNSSLIVDNLGDNGIFVVDETGFIKKGDKSAGVKRQYSGTAGRIENSQVGVFASYKTDIGHGLIDRELYIPQEWIDDKDRCKKAGIDQDREFLTKPQLATKMYNHFLEINNNNNKPSWVTADEAYGRDPSFKKNLEKNDQQYVLAIPKSNKIQIGLRRLSANKWSDMIFLNDWSKLSCGEGNKGKRLYNWSILERSEKCQNKGFKRYLLIRQSLTNKEDLAFYAVFCKEDMTLQEIINVAGARWSVEECFKIAKGQTGLDQYEVRTFKGWYRHITLSIFAFTILIISQGILLEQISKNNSLSEFKKKQKQEQKKYLK